MTENARTILNVINNSFCHPTAEDIYMAVNSSNGHMSMATVYNNLNTLCGEGLVRRIPIEGQADRFDKTLPHDHLICRKCGRIEDLYLKDITPSLKEMSGIDMCGYDLRIIHICESCRDKIKTQKNKI